MSDGGQRVTVRDGLGGTGSGYLVDFEMLYPIAFDGRVEQQTTLQHLVLGRRDGFGDVQRAVLGQVHGDRHGAGGIVCARGRRRDQPSGTER
ncbi:Uncharacterised protein [Mycobacteroides abscessus subsp. bolletii]|nr:Uncharacterised protein [Mycobacteroides abscessus subsp. bolletii]